VESAYPVDTMMANLIKLYGLIQWIEPSTLPTTGATSAIYRNACDSDDNAKKCASGFKNVYILK